MFKLKHSVDLFCVSLNECEEYEVSKLSRVDPTPSIQIYPVI
jgi:hypothetical protein